MPKFELEIDEKGEFIGDLPQDLKAIKDRWEITAHGNGFRSGQGKAEEEFKRKLDEALKAERVKLEASMPAERAKWADIEEQNKILKTQYDTTLQEHRKLLTAREEAHAAEILKRTEAIKVRDQRIRESVKANLRSLAAQNGARDESLEELEIVLQHRVGFDDDMVPFVKAEDGTPAKTTAGNAVSLDVFVRQYLDNHPHHRKPAAGKGGNAGHGATLTAPRSDSPSLDAARQRVEGGDRSPAAINDLFEASRRRRAS